MLTIVGEGVMRMVANAFVFGRLRGLRPEVAWREGSDFLGREMAGDALPGNNHDPQVAIGVELH